MFSWHATLLHTLQHEKHVERTSRTRTFISNGKPSPIVHDKLETHLRAKWNPEYHITLLLSTSCSSFCSATPAVRVSALAGVDLLSLDGLRAVSCLDSVAFPEVRRFLHVAKWVYKVGGGVLERVVAESCSAES